MLTQDQISEAVAEVLPSVLRGFKSELQESILRQARDQAVAQVNKAVTEWVTSELVPEIKLALVESKDGLIAAAPKLAESLTEAMVSAFSETVKNKLETSWERKKIFEALLS
jgi:hypothetical protein